MAHQIDMTLGKAAVAFYGKTPWHGLGTEIKTRKKASEILETAGLDWQVEKIPAKFVDPLGNVQPGYGYQTVRNDTWKALGMVGCGYHVLQNDLIAEAADKLFPRARVEVAGSIRGGRDVWYLLRDTSNRIFAEEDHRRYYLLTNNHGGNSSFRIMSTTVRVVCANMLSMALRAKNGVRLRHTSGAVDLLTNPERLEEEIVHQDTFLFTAMERMRDQRADELTRRNYFKTVFGFDPAMDEKDLPKVALNTFDNLEMWHAEGIGQEEIRGTLYGAYNAVTGYLTHDRKYAGKEGQELQEHRAVDLTNGTSANYARKALKLAAKSVDLELA